LTAPRLVFRAVFGWTALVLLLALGLVTLTTAVETTASAPHALLAALLRGPGLLLPLLPAAVGLGAGLAAARMEARGERAALQASGLGPGRTGRAAAAAGLLWALLGAGLQGGLVWPAERAARAWVPAPTADWVLLDGLALRPADETAIRVGEGRLERVAAGEIDPARFVEARELERPAQSRLPLLWSHGGPAGLRELQGRGGRLVQAGLLAWLCWLPLGRSPGSQVGLALLLSLGLCGGDLLFGALAAQGRLGGLVAVGLPVVILSAILVFGLRRRG
jgi:hypothetical protein